MKIDLALGGICATLVACALCSPEEKPQPVRRDVGVPPDHGIVAKDGDGFYWVEVDALASWPKCMGCHAGRWTQASPVSVTPVRLEYVDGERVLREKP